MTFERHIAGLSGLTDDSWERHANGWSVWTRFTGPALLMLAAWSRIWLGWWALGFGALVIAWIAANPFLFGRPASPNGYAARGTLGERIWMNRDRIAVPAKHRILPPWLTIVNALGFAAAIYGVVVLDAWTVVLGLSVHYLGKAWFIDRMVWLADDMVGTMGRAVVLDAVSEPTA